MGHWSPSRGPRAGAGRRPLSASRAAILDLLRDQPEPLTQAAVVRATGLHPNTVREHLDGLVRRGLVRRTAAPPSGRGRPAYLYAHLAEPGEGEYAHLAAALAGALASASADPAGQAVALGEEWGRELQGERRAGARPVSGSDAAVALLDDLGFEPRPGEVPGEVRLTRCPLLQAAHREPTVVCGIHLGIVRAVLRAHGTDPGGSELEPFAGPGYCRLRLPADAA